MTQFILGKEIYFKFFNRNQFAAPQYSTQDDGRICFVIAKKKVLFRFNPEKLKYQLKIPGMFSSL